LRDRRLEVSVWISLTIGLREFEEKESQGKAVEMNVNNKEEKVFRLLYAFLPRIFT
jgi:hypothetical protein